MDGHVGTVDVAVDVEGGNESEKNDKNCCKEWRWPWRDGIAAVVVLLGPSHRAAVPASAEEFVEICCCLPFLNLLDCV